MTKEYAISTCDECEEKFLFDKGTIVYEGIVAIYLCPECIKIRDEWNTQYIERLVHKAEMTYREAKDILSSGQHDYNDNPEDAADEELSYWSSAG